MQSGGRNSGVVLHESTRCKLKEDEERREIAQWDDWNVVMVLFWIPGDDGRTSLIDK